MNHFLLIIFDHSIWLGFELFGSRVHVHSHWVHFLCSCAKDMTITIVIINPQTGTGAGLWMTSCSEEMVQRIWRFWKDVSWDVAIGPWKHRVEFLPLRHRVEFSTVAAAVKFFGSRPAEMNWDLKHHKMRRVLEWSQIVWLAQTFKNCVSLHEVAKLYNTCLWMCLSIQVCLVCISVSCHLYRLFQYFYIFTYVKLPT